MALLLFAAVSCRSHKQAAAADYGGMSLNGRVACVTEGYKPWSELNLPLKLSLRAPQKLSVSGRIYMRRDSDIYITLRVLGMEVANIYVNTDSVYAADRIHKYYFAEPISDIFAGASLSIGNIQDAITGRAFINNDGTISSKASKLFTVSDDTDNTWVITPRTKINGDIAYQFRFSDATNALISLVFNIGGKLYGCTYSDPTDIGGSRFMQQLDIKTTAGKTAIDATVTLDFNKAKWEMPATARWRHRDGYRRITPESLTKALQDN